MEGDWVAMCMGFHAYKRNNKNERMVGLMGGESEWHRRIWAWGGRVVRK